MKATGIIFSNIYDGAMGELTKKRASASLPIGGRYRLIDFMLSNMVNSGITSVGVLTKYNYRSLLDHLGSGSEWDLNRKNGGLYILPPFTSGDSAEPRGKFEAMYNAIPFLNRIKTDYVVMCDATVLCRIDFEKVVEEHILSGADITVVAKKENKKYNCDENEISFELSEGKISEIFVGRRTKEENPVGMGIYVMSRTRLIKEVEDYVSKGRYGFEKDFIQAEFIAKNIKVNLINFDGIVLRNKNIESYYKNNLKLMENKVRKEFFGQNLPIYTKIRYEVPTMYGENCRVDDCFVADGCRILGEAENSVIFRDVILEEGVKVKNCVIMQGAKILKNAKIENAIIEKNVVVNEKETYKGASNSPVIIK